MRSINYKKISYYLVPLNILFDISLSFFAKGGVIPILRAALLVSFLLFIIFKYWKNNKFYLPILFFGLYCLTMIAFSSNFLISLNITIKVLVSIFSFIVGFNVINNIKALFYLNKAMFGVLIILIINYLFSQALGIGVASYTESSDFLTGNLDGWDLYTYSVLVVPMISFFYKKEKKKIWVLYLVAIANAALVFLSIKRTAIIALVGGFLINALYNFKLKKAFRYIIILLIASIIVVPLAFNLFEERIAARSERFEEGALEKEGRYQETFYVWDEIGSFKDPERSLFGLEAFNSVGNYAGGYFGIRQLHVDYNLMANTIGLIGLFLYLYIFWAIFKTYRKFWKLSILPLEFKKLLKSTFLTLFFMQFVTSVSGQMYSISFRMIIFIYMGSIIGILKNSNSKTIL